MRDCLHARGTGLNSHWFRRLEIALEFDSGFEIFLLLGRGELARPALGRIAEELRRFGTPHWHRLHLDGLDTLLTADQPEGVLHLVHGFERMAEAAAADMAARLNVNRDRLEVLRGPVIFWIAEDFYEELLRQAPDFVAWRSQATIVSDADIGVSPGVLAEEFLLCETHKASADALREVPPLDVLDDGVRKPILDWLAEGSVRSLCYEVEDSPLRIMSWCAGQLARRRDGGEYDKVPVLLPSLLLALARRSDGLFEGIANLWQANALHIVIAAAITIAEWDSLAECAGDNRLLVAVHDQRRDCVPVAPLDDRQIQLLIANALFDVDQRERELWQDVMSDTIQCFEERIGRVGVLAAVIRYWRDRGLSAVTRTLQKRGWREHSFWLSGQYYLQPSPSAPSTPLAQVADFLARPTTTALARSLYEFGCSPACSESRESLLRASISLYRAETCPHPSAALVETMIALARSLEAAVEEELPVWTEAVVLARDLEPSNLALLTEALDGLGFAQHLAGDEDAAERTVQEALLLASESAQSPPAVLAKLRVTLGYSLRGQGLYAEALAIANQALSDLEGVSEADEAWQEQGELLEICDGACMQLGMEERALEFATRRLELRRSKSQKFWLEQTLFADRLLELGRFEQALSALTEAVDLLSTADGDSPPYLGQAHPLISLAEVHRALGDRERAIAATQEAIRVYRAVFADGGASWSTTELAEALFALADDLQSLDRAEALDHLLEAVDILEHVEQSSYPVDLAAALTELGDYAAGKQMYELATAAYARVLALAEPFPARTSEPVLAIERRLHELCRESNIALDDALARGRQPIRASS